MLEKDLERKVVSRVRSEGGLCLKWVSPGFTGVPDRIVILPGNRVFFVELKRPGRKNGLSPRQERVIGRLRALGCTVLVTDKLEEIDEYI